jgi:hypothetical protein
MISIIFCLNIFVGADSDPQMQFNEGRLFCFDPFFGFAFLQLPGRIFLFVIFMLEIGLVRVHFDLHGTAQSDT